MLHMHVNTHTVVCQSLVWSVFLFMDTDQMENMKQYHQEPWGAVLRCVLLYKVS